jgi:hypothetical protein
MLLTLAPPKSRPNVSEDGLAPIFVPGVMRVLWVIWPPLRLPERTQMGPRIEGSQARDWKSGSVAPGSDTHIGHKTPLRARRAAARTIRRTLQAFEWLAALFAVTTAARLRLSTVAAWNTVL